MRTRRKREFLDDMRFYYCKQHSKMVADLMKRNDKTTLVVFGGDTLIAIIEHMNATELFILPK